MSTQAVAPRINGTILSHFREPLWESKKRFIVLQGGAGSGKAVPGNTKVITPDGYTLMRDIRIGDEVCDSNGGVVTVLEKYNPPTSQMYEFEFADGRKSIACKDHLWDVFVATPKHSPKRKTLCSEELFNLFNDGKKLSLPLTKPVYHTHKDLPIPPYLLGLILGDGYINRYGTISVVSNDKEVSDYILNNGFATDIRDKSGTNAKSYTIPFFKKEIEELGLSRKHSNDKFIPEIYLLSSIEDRFELLRGLMDTDGTCGKEGTPSYCTISPVLANNVASLVRSLGGKATIFTKETHYTLGEEKIPGQLAYNIYIRFPDVSTPIFKIKRKQDRVKPYNGGRMELHLAIKSIKPIKYSGDMYCIKVDSDDHLYLIDDYIVTHNSHAICQRVCYRFLTEENIIVAVVRASMPILKKTVYMGDPSIVRTLRDWGVPIDSWLNKTETKIVNPQNHSEIWFVGLDSAEKIKSQNLNLIYIEEATELTLEKWSQLNTRLRRPHPPEHPNQMYIAYNPISVFNWVIQQFIVAPSEYIKENTLVNFSNFTQNPFVSKEDVIGWLDTAEKDENYYWAYIVGKPGVPLGQIYPAFIFSPRNGVKDEETGEYVVDPWPKEVWEQEPYYGIDWGYVDPTVIVECRDYNGTTYVINRFYKKEQPMNQIIQAMRNIGINSSHMLYCDSAEQDRIHDLSLAGFCPNDAAKSKHAGITFVKGCRIVVDSTGDNGEFARTEVNSYSWAKDPDDPRIFLDEPDEDTPDHFCDALRYAKYTKHLRDTRFSVASFDEDKHSSAAMIEEVKKKYLTKI